MLIFSLTYKFKKPTMVNRVVTTPPSRQSQVLVTPMFSSRQPIQQNHFLQQSLNYGGHRPILMQQSFNENIQFNPNVMSNRYSPLLSMSPSPMTTPSPNLFKSVSSPSPIARDNVIHRMMAHNQARRVQPFTLTNVSSTSKSPSMKDDGQISFSSLKSESPLIRQNTESDSFRDNQTPDINYV